MPELVYFHQQASRAYRSQVTVFPDRDLALFCSSCGQIWGRVGLLAPGRKWFVMSRGCSIPHARDLLDIPGSLLVDQMILRLWPAPRDLLLAELELCSKGAGFAFPLSARYNYDSQSVEAGPMSPELSSRIAELRTKALSNTITTEELKEALGLLREDRKFAAAKSGAASRTARAAAAAPVDTEALLKSFF